MRYLAHFTPQAWINDRAHDCDLQGDNQWDVTAHLTALAPPERAAAMEADSYASDELRDLPQAPAWVREWSGPFAVRVTAAPENEVDRALLRLCSDLEDTPNWEHQSSEGAVHAFRERTSGEIARIEVLADGWSRVEFA